MLMLQSLLLLPTAFLVRSARPPASVGKRPWLLVSVKFAKIFLMKRATAPRKRKYEAAETSAEVRDALASVGNVLKKRGSTVKEIKSVYDEAGFSFSERSLYGYIGAAAKGRSPMPSSKASGGKRKLEETQRHVLAGLFLSREDEGLKSGLPLYASSAKAMFGVSVSKATGSRYLKEDYLSRKKLGPRERAQKETEDERVFAYFELVKGLHDVHLFNVDPSHVWNIDVVSNKQRNDDTIMYGRFGGTQRKSKRAKIEWTDSIITMVNMLGEQLGPFITSSNPDLNPFGSNRKKLMKTLRHLGLRAEDIDYRKDGKSFSKEDRKMYKKFLGNHRPWDGHYVLTDNATLYIENDKCIFETLGFDGAPRLTSCIHGAASLLDGVVHPHAKPRWRSIGTKGSRNGSELYISHTVLLQCQRT